MYGKLVLGVILAAMGPQDPTTPQDTVKREVRVQGVHVEVPAIDIPEIDIRIPGFAFRFDDYDRYFEEKGWESLEIHIPGLVLEMPSIAVALPTLDIPIAVVDWGEHGDGWDDWDADAQGVDTDTTFAVNPRATLGVRNHAGEILIRTWDRDEVRIEARHGSRDRVKVLHSEASVKVKSETRHGHPDVVDYEITVPRTMAVDLWGFTTDISVDGVRNDVRAETMQGDISINSVQGDISLRSVEGQIGVRRCSGSLEVNGVEDDILIIEFEGDLFSESIDGDIRLEEINSSKVEAKTVDGDVHFDGAISDSGRYRLTTHDGDVTVLLPDAVNAEVSVATFDGEFVADFPVKLDRTEASRRFSFILGSGAARIELHSFDGDIHLLRR